MTLVKIKTAKRSFGFLVHIAEDMHTAERDEHGNPRSTRNNYYVRCHGASAKWAWSRAYHTHPTCLWCVANKQFGPMGAR